MPDGVSLLGCFAEPPRRFRMIFGNAEALLVPDPQKKLRGSISLLGRLSEPSDGFCVIASNTLTGTRSNPI